jgi:hypothetical protein
LPQGPKELGLKQVSYFAIIFQRPAVEYIWREEQNKTNEIKKERQSNLLE